MDKVNTILNNFRSEDQQQTYSPKASVEQPGPVNPMQAQMVGDTQNMPQFQAAASSRGYNIKSAKKSKLRNRK